MTCSMRVGGRRGERLEDICKAFRPAQYLASTCTPREQMSSCREPHLPVCFLQPVNRALVQVRLCQSSRFQVVEAGLDQLSFSLNRAFVKTNVLTMRQATKEYA